MEGRREVAAGAESLRSSSYGTATLDEDYAMGVARRPVQWSMAELIDRSAGQSGGKRRTAAPECATWTLLDDEEVEAFDLCSDSESLVDELEFDDVLLVI